MVAERFEVAFVYSDSHAVHRDDDHNVSTVLLTNYFFAHREATHHLSGLRTKVVWFAVQGCARR